MNYINNFSKFKNFRQFTLNKIINFSGVGVHNGRAVSMSVEPADINTGIVFIRTDVKSNNIVKAVIDSTFDSNLCTKIKNSHDISALVSSLTFKFGIFSCFEVSFSRFKLGSNFFSSVFSLPKNNEKRLKNVLGLVSVN